VLTNVYLSEIVGGEKNMRSFIAVSQFVFCAFLLCLSGTLAAQPAEPAETPTEAASRPARPADPAARPTADSSPPAGGVETPEESAPPPADKSTGPLPGAQDTALPKKDKPAVLYGVGLDYQFLIVPQFFLKAFLKAAKSDDHNLYRHGFGAHFVRRKGNLDMVVRLMFGFFMSSQDDGNWLGRGHGFDEIDYTEFQDLNFLWADITFIYNWEIAKNLYFGAGGGIGLGWVMGQVHTTESYANGTPGSPCSSTNYDDCSICRPISGCASNCTADGCDIDKSCPSREKEKVPPVLPALNGVVSLRYDIWRHTSVRLNTGIFLPGFWMMNLSAEWVF
jgi:hypothetical protein